jgi:hypothetical protein
MAYSNSMHFSDKLSYKILFISSYGLKDTNFARWKYLQEFQKKNRNWAGPEPEWRRVVTDARLRRTAVGGSGLRPNRGAGSEPEKEREKG